MSTRKQCSPDTTEHIRTPGNCDSTHMTWEGSSKSNPAWRGEMNTKFHALANEQLTTGSYRERESWFSLRVWPWQVYDTPAEGHTPKSAWAAGTVLDGLKI